jgi:hypothetical protein
MANEQLILTAHPGARVRVTNSKGTIANGTIERVDDTVPPFGVIVVRTDDNEVVTVPVGVGWPDDHA